jgi:LPS-assembly protein
MRCPRYFAPAALKRLHPVACAALLVCTHALAQSTRPEPALKLKISPLLQENFTPEQSQQQPTFILGRDISGRPDLETVIEGEAELRRSGTVLRADRIEYYHPEDLAKARGNVRLNRDGNVYQGTQGEMKLEAQEGFFLQPRYKLLKNGAHGQASRVDFIDSSRSVLRDATYSTCECDPQEGAKPAWILRASQVNIDTDTGVGEAVNGRLEFKGVPILGAPFLTFPLSDARKSGWLPPSINIDNLSGFEVVVPYYLNLAPNRDATLYPGVMSKRGLNAGAEFRYLEQDYRGSVRLDAMPRDNLRKRSRWGLTATHNGAL